MFQAGEEMIDVGFVIFDKKSAGRIISWFAKCGLLRFRIVFILYHLIHKKRFRTGTKVVEIEPGIEVLIIGLPFPETLIRSLNFTHIEQIILKSCSEKNCRRYLVPQAIKCTGAFASSASISGVRSIVYRSLLIPILQKLYVDKNIRLDSLNIVMVHERNLEVLLALVQQIEPFMKYIYVTAKDREIVEDSLEGLCDDSGISIFVSSDFKNAIRNSDLVICLGQVPEGGTIHLKPGTTVINYAEEEIHAISGDFSCITGVEYLFPISEYTVLGEDVQRCYSKTELTDILMIWKMGFPDELFFNENIAKHILGIYRNNNCFITDFYGRRGLLHLFDTKKLQSH